MEKYKYIEVRCNKTHEVIKRIDVSDKSDSAIVRIERGININLDHDNYYTDSHSSKTKKDEITQIKLLPEAEESNKGNDLWSQLYGVVSEVNGFRLSNRTMIELKKMFELTLKYP